MGKYLDFYKKCMETGKLPPRRIGRMSLPANGLCSDETVGFNVREWFAHEADLLDKADRNEGWWGTATSGPGRPSVFCERRQNMILLLAAIHGEL